MKPVLRADKGGFKNINVAFNVCAWEEYLEGQTARLPKLPDVKQITSRVLRILGQNPGKFTLQGTNTYVLGTGKERIIIDTGGGEPEWADLIKAEMERRDLTISRVLLTHWHGDHTGGVPDLLDIFPDLRDHIYKRDPDSGQQNIADNQIFSVEGATVRAVFSPGHATDHMCFVLEEENCMFTGDNILGHGTSVVEDLGTYSESCRKMADQNCAIGYSAHGEVIADLPAKIRGEIQVRERREAQIMKGFVKLFAQGEKFVAVRDLVAEIYGQGVDAATRDNALEPFIAEALRKLAGDGRVGFSIRGGKRLWFSLELP